MPDRYENVTESEPVGDVQKHESWGKYDAGYAILKYIVVCEIISSVQY